MDVTVSILPYLFVLPPLIAAILIMITGNRNPDVREFWTILAGIINFGLVFYVYRRILDGQILESVHFTIVPNVSFFLKIDTTGMIFAGVASLLWIVTSFYSIGYMRAANKINQTGYFASFAMCIFAALGISFAGNLFTLFIFYEVLTIATYPLVIHNREQEHIEAGRKYLAYTLITGQIFLVGIIWLYHLTGTTDFVAGGFIQNVDNPTPFIMIFLLMVIGASAKAGLIPLHGWLPAAMVAPTPVSALLHAVAVVKAGAFVLVRIIGYVFGFDLLASLGVIDYLAWAAAFTIIIASVIAMRQDNLKRRLAFSTIGQLSYIILGLALINEQAFMGALFHIVAHAFMKITLFFCAGAIFINTGYKYISQIHGIGKQMPITMAMFGIASLGISGMPFTVGFISKWNLALGAIAGGNYLYIFVLIASAMLSASYLVTVFVLAFYNKNEEFTEFREVRKDILIPILITGAMSIILGIFPDAGPHFYELAIRSAEIVANGTGG